MEPMDEGEITEEMESDEVIALLAADYFSDEERQRIKQCIEYADSGWTRFPGHNLIVLVAKMAKFYDFPGD